MVSNMFDYKLFKKEMQKRGHEVHKKGNYIIIEPNNNYKEYAKGFFSAWEVVDGFEDYFKFISMDHFNTWIYSVRFKIA